MQQSKTGNNPRVLPPRAGCTRGPLLHKEGGSSGGWLTAAPSEKARGETGYTLHDPTYVNNMPSFQRQEAAAHRGGHSPGPGPGVHTPDHAHSSLTPTRPLAWKPTPLPCVSPDIPQEGQQREDIGRSTLSAVGSQGPAPCTHATRPPQGRTRTCVCGPRPPPPLLQPSLHPHRRGGDAGAAASSPGLEAQGLFVRRQRIRGARPAAKAGRGRPFLLETTDATWSWSRKPNAGAWRRTRPRRSPQKGNV